MSSFQFEAIGQIESPFKEKFGIPRQPGLARSIESRVVLDPRYSDSDAFDGLEQCSHIWLIFIFSRSLDTAWRPKVRPPRLGGNRKLGVFATRAPVRPNPVGLSAVELCAIEREGKQQVLRVRGADLLDGTPIIDIKPYLPYSDCLNSAQFPLADAGPALEQPVSFSAEAEQQYQAIRDRYPVALKQQIEELLSCDPRPAYQDHSDRIYGIQLYDLNIRFSISHEQIEVIELSRLDPQSVL